MWSDSESAIDLLGFRVHADLLRDIVTAPELLPVTVGLFGDWGSGKSSVIRMLANDLGENGSVACLHFNAWQFEDYDDAKSALLQAILVELLENRALYPKIRDKAKSLLKRVNWLRVAQLGYKHVVAPLAVQAIAGAAGMPPAAPMTVVDPPADAGGESSAEGIQGLDEDLADLVKEAPQSKPMLEVRRFRRDFEDLIADTKLIAVVILIDDLDRCSPDRLIETLEAIKLFLAVPRMAFVIGADERIVRYAIAQRYDTGKVESQEGGTDGALDLVTDYLEKLIQIPHHLPRLSRGELESYMNLLFCQLHLGAGATTVVDAFQAFRSTDPTSAFGHESIKAAASNTFNDALATDLGWCSQIAVTLSDVLKGNPRQTKRLLNAMMLRKKLAAAAKISINDHVLLKLMLLEYIRPKLFTTLYNWQSTQNGHPQELRALEEHASGGDDADLLSLSDKIRDIEAGWDDARCVTWLNMPPKLSEHDLRDYYWLSRDRVAGLTSGVGLMSAHLRKSLGLLLTGEPQANKELLQQLHDLDADDQETLLSELEERFLRSPADNEVIKAWEVVTSCIDSGAERLVRLLENVNAKSITAVLPMKLAVVAQSHSVLLARAQSLLQTWSADGTTKTKRSAGVALRQLQKGQ